MRRIKYVSALVALFMVVTAVPAGAAAPEKFQIFDFQMYADWSDGPRQVHVSVGESDGMGYLFYVNVEMCDYESPTGPVCWQDTNENVVVHSYSRTTRGGHLDADVEIRSVFDSSAPRQVVRVTIDLATTDPEVTRTTTVSRSTVYGFSKTASVQYYDASPDVSVVFDELLIDIPLPPLARAEFRHSTWSEMHTAAS